MRRIITLPVLVLHTVDLPFGVYCVVLLVLSLYFPFSHWLNSVSFVLVVFLSSCLVLLWLFCSGLTCFLLPSLVLLLFPLLVLFGIVRPSVGLVTAPSLVSVSIPVYLFFCCIAYCACWWRWRWRGWNGGWVLNLSLGGGFEFLKFFESAALRRP